MLSSTASSSFSWVLLWLFGIVTAIILYLRVLLFNSDGEFVYDYETPDVLDNELVRGLFAVFKDMVSPIQALMLPSVMLGVAYRTRKFAKEGFHDVISISLSMFVPSNNEQGYALAVRTLKEASLQDVFIDECAVDSLKTAAMRSVSMNQCQHAFCDFQHLSDPQQTVTRFREYCNSKLSDLFCIFQTLSAMRVGPIVTRTFCWAVIYESSLHNTWAHSYKRQTSKQVTTSQHVLSNKFRLILVELDCLRQSHLKSSHEIPHEIHGDPNHKRWESIQEMQDLFDFTTGMPKENSTTLCGSVIFSAPVMVSDALREWSFAPWESWK